ncbi:MAG: hypothetical protein NTV56_19535, partial [Alphaproteobacteria bacterium]|nr:hypothetical protein [Alphaproteobacteria bacterium]
MHIGTQGIEHPNIVSARLQFAQDMLSDEARAAGQQNFHFNCPSAAIPRGTDRNETARRKNVTVIFQAA